MTLQEVYAELTAIRNEIIREQGARSEGEALTDEEKMHFNTAIGQAENALTAVGGLKLSIDVLEESDAVTSLGV